MLMGVRWKNVDMYASISGAPNSSLSQYTVHDFICVAPKWLQTALCLVLEFRRKFAVVDVASFVPSGTRFHIPQVIKNIHTSKYYY